MEYNISREEFERKYDLFLNKLFDKNGGYFHKLKTYGGQSEFGIFRNKNSIYVKAITEKQTRITISKKQLSDVLSNNKNYLYSSYEPIIIDYIINDKLDDLSELCEYGDYYKCIDKKEVENKYKMKIKNIMLYGAPGVGKTYNYKRLICMIEEGKSESEIFDTIKNRADDKDFDFTSYETIKNEKRMEFITFHQSYPYEDFIEGFRPSEDGNIKLEDGIFKKLCEEADINFLKSKSNIEILFIDALNILLKEKIENQENVKISLKRNNSYFNIYDYNDKTIYFEKQNGDKSHTLSIKTLEKMYYDETNNIINGGLAPYYNPVLEKLLKIKTEQTVEKTEQKNFYIIIDEINRGNISKIFGELITLIEENKRGKKEYEVTLPYSKDKFLIPENLYIIATMNSTDKSIATIDIALRRRFTFLKMEPKSELIKDEKAKKLMEDLNSFIEKTRGEEYMLGHSYFMSNLDLDFIKEYKLQPLLEEYFYGDEENYKEALKILNIKKSNQ